jgi:hypothetical protein
MSELGYLYPFTVYAQNKFKLNYGEIKINVNYFLDNAMGVTHRHTLYQGERIGFPLWRKEDYLELSIVPPEGKDKYNLPDTYYISGVFWCNVEFSPKGAAELVEEKQFIIVDKSDMKNGKIKIGQVIEEAEKLKDTPQPVYRKWKIKENTWKMTLSKPDHDPEDDDIIVGPDTPG